MAVFCADLLAEGAS